MARNKTTQVPIGFTPRHREMIEEIMLKLGYPSMASVVQQAVVAFHKDTFKDYVMAKRARGEQGEGLVAGEVKKSQQTDTFYAIAKKLKGEVVEKGGVLMCIYYTYDRRNRYKQEVPLESLSQMQVDKQFFPSKKEIEELQKAGKVNYKIGE